MNREQAERIIEALYKDDVWFCSVPHGQYEGYVPHSRERAIEKLMEASNA